MSKEKQPKLYFRGTSRPKVFPIGESNQVFDESHTKGRAREIKFTNFCGKAITSEGIADTITASYGELSGQSTKLLEITKNQSQGYRVYDPEGISSTLAGEAGGVGAKTGLYAVGGLQKNAAKMKDCSPTLMQGMGTGGGNVPVIIPVLTPDRLKKRQHGRRFKEDGDPSFTLTSQDKHGVFDGAKIRRLTPTECERLQGFPDGWTEYGINEKGEQIKISDTQRYRSLGNAVTTNVIKEIITKLLVS